MTSCPIETWQERAERIADSFFTWDEPTEQDETQPSDLDERDGNETNAEAVKGADVNAF
jgi:hypothetical protein